MNAPVSYVKGDDPVLRDTEVSKLVDKLLGDVDKLYAFEDFVIEARRRATGDDDDAVENEPEAVDLPIFRSIMNALSSPPFMTPVRVVAVRNIGGLNAEQAGLLAQYIADPLDGIYLVMVAGGGRVNTALDKAIKAASVPIIAPKSEKTEDVLETALRAAELVLANSAKKAIIDRLGNDAGRVPELVALFESTFGRGSQLRVEDIEPYLGEGGAVAPYMLTNAVDAGDTSTALDVLQRLLNATSSREPKPMHPLQIMGMLTRHYESLVRIDSPDVKTKQQAAAVLGIKDYPAGIRLSCAQRMGSRGIGDAFRLLAQADLDFRGGVGGSRAIPSETVIELLVVRLCGIAKRAGSRAPARSGGWRN